MEVALICLSLAGMGVAVSMAVKEEKKNQELMNQCLAECLNRNSSDHAGKKI